jgi:hypothetical protein
VSSLVVGAWAGRLMGESGNRNWQGYSLSEFRASALPRVCRASLPGNPTDGKPVTHRHDSLGFHWRGERRAIGADLLVIGQSVDSAFDRQAADKLPVKNS